MNLVDSLAVFKLCFVFAFFVEPDLSLSNIHYQSQFYFKRILSLFANEYDESALVDRFFERVDSMRNFPPYTPPQNLLNNMILARFLFYRARTLNIRSIRQFLLLDLPAERISNLICKIVTAVTDHRLDEPAQYDWDFNYSEDPVTYEEICGQRAFAAKQKPSDENHAANRVAISSTNVEESVEKAKKASNPIVKKNAAAPAVKKKATPSLYDQIAKICKKKK